MEQTYLDNWDNKTKTREAYFAAMERILEESKNEDAKSC